MSEWNLYFEIKNEKIFDVIKSLKKNKLLEFIELSDEYGKNKKKVEFKDLPSLEQIKDMYAKDDIEIFKN